MVHLTLHLNRVVVLETYLQQAIAQGYTFSTLAAMPNEEDVYHLHQECRKAQPPLDTHQVPQDPAVWRRIWTARKELYFVLLSGSEGVGVCGLHETDATGVLECGFTGTLPAHKGRGLATALKAHAILKARLLGAERLTTNVREDNPAMLAINRRLGFVEHARPTD